MRAREPFPIMPAELPNRGNDVDALGEKDFSALAPARTALILVEFQNEFTSPGGKLYDSVRESMEKTGMLETTSALADRVRSSGVLIMHSSVSGSLAEHSRLSQVQLRIHCCAQTD